MNILVNIVVISIIILSIIKMLDMIIFSIIWNIRHGKSYADEFHRCLNTKNNVSFEEIFKDSKRNDFDPMKVIKKYGKMPAMKFFFNYIYRWPVLLLLLSLLALLKHEKSISLTIVVVLLLMILVEVIHQFISRLILGVVDNINRYAYFDVVGSPLPENETWHVTRILRDNILTLMIQIFCIIMAFSSVFWILHRFYAIFSVDSNVGNYIDVLYYSLTTVTTVGFGDIKVVTLLGKCICMFLMLSAWSLIVLLFAHFLASLSIKLDRSYTKSGDED